MDADGGRADLLALPASRLQPAYHARAGPGAEVLQAVPEALDREPLRRGPALLHDRLVRVDRLLRPGEPGA